jgi:hypothetical protein
MSHFRYAVANYTTCTAGLVSQNRLIRLQNSAAACFIYCSSFSSTNKIAYLYRGGPFWQLLTCKHGETAKKEIL